MLEIFLIVIVYFLAFVHGWISREDYASKRVDALLNEYESQVKQELHDKTIKITIEQHEGKYFVYGMDDKSYLASGQTKKELEENLATRFPGKVFAATKENLKEVGF
jgi:hypothetical protein